jgi:hypothetical protein
MKGIMSGIFRTSFVPFDSALSKSILKIPEYPG